MLLACAAALTTVPATASAATGPALTVDAGADQHPISPDIYGLNFADPMLGAAIGLPIDRWGGNTTDTYNWRLGTANTGSDYYFENVADCWDPSYGYCSGLTKNNVFGYRVFVAKDRSLGSKTLLTMPMVGYVAKDAPVNQPLTCGYPQTKFPAQDSFDPYDPGCGNGQHNGTVLPGTPANDGVVPDSTFYTGWLADLINRYGTAAQGGVQTYELGNEPALWSFTHSDVHPAPENANQLWQKSRALATTIKTADPSAKVLGFSDWGWPAYFCTGADTYGSGCDASGCTTSPDCVNHGHLPIAEWLLRQFAGYDASTGIRHLDYLDVHYYAQGGSTPDVTRSLWDPTYTDPSWISSMIQLIPRMKQWVSAYYPGTKLSLSEYNLSLPGLDAVTNAIIQADVLGIFAREGLDLATRWPLGDDGNLIGDAFRMYRNYDGQHSTFGDTWIRSTSADQSQLAVYGARRSSDGAYTLMVLNKTGGTLTSPLTLSNIPPRYGAATTRKGLTAIHYAQVWQWTGGNITQSARVPISPGWVIRATYPAKSMTLYVIRPMPPAHPGFG